MRSTFAQKDSEMFGQIGSLLETDRMIKIEKQFLRHPHAARLG